MKLHDTDQLVQQFISYDTEENEDCSSSLKDSGNNVTTDGPCQCLNAEFMSGIEELLLGSDDDLTISNWLALPVPADDADTHQEILQFTASFEECSSNDDCSEPGGV